MNNKLTIDNVTIEVKELKWKLSARGGRIEECEWLCGFFSITPLIDGKYELARYAKSDGILGYFENVDEAKEVAQQYVNDIVKSLIKGAYEDIDDI